MLNPVRMVIVIHGENVFATQSREEAYQRIREYNLAGIIPDVLDRYNRLQPLPDDIEYVTKECLE